MAYYRLQGDIFVDEATGIVYEDRGPVLGMVAIGASGSTYVEPTQLAGERNIGTSNQYFASVPECNITRCDIDQTETLVTAVPCLVFAVIGNDGNTGYTDLIDAAAIGGGSTPKLRVNVGDGTASVYLQGAKFNNGLCVDGESLGHDVTVFWRPQA